MKIEKIIEEIRQEWKVYALQLVGIGGLLIVYLMCCFNCLSSWIDSVAFWMMVIIAVLDVILHGLDKDTMTRWFRQQFPYWFTVGLMCVLVWFRWHCFIKYGSQWTFTDYLVSVTVGHLMWPQKGSE